MTLFTAFGQFAGQAAVAAAAGAWQIVTPSSIANSGGTASINSSGSITMSGVTTLNVNGAFDATYDDYAFIFTGTLTTYNLHALRLRASGADATGTDYSVSGFNVNGTSIQDRHFLRDLMRIGAAYTAPASIYAGFIHRPFLATQTTFRVVHGGPEATNTATLNEYAGMHTLTNSYDGFTWFNDGAGATTGTLTVMGKQY